MVDTTTEQSNAEKLAAFKAQHPDKVQVIPSNAQQAENVGTVAADVKVVEDVKVEPKSFPVTGFMQSGIQSYVTVMTFSDVMHYTAYAKELYTVETDSDGKVMKPAIEQTWQRMVSAKRVKGIGEYLHNETHFLPPLLCVPRDDEYCQLITDEKGMLTMRIGADGLGVLDGQHRRGGIIASLMNGKRNGSDGIDALEMEGIPVVIMMVADTDQRQQIFADVNRTPKLVSKALNLMFDHRDALVNMAKHIASIPNEHTPNGKWGFDTIVDMESLTPKKTSNHVLSFTNLHSFLSKFAGMKNTDGSQMFSDELVTEIFRAIIEDMPDAQRIRKNTSTYGVARSEFVCYSSTAWQALGNVVRDLTLAKDADGKPLYELSSLPVVIGTIVHDTDWRLSAPKWLDPNRLVVTGNGKVGTQTGHVSAATAIIRETLNEPKK